MNTNQTFNWKRFTAALRKEWAENRTMLLLIIAGIFLFYLLIFSLNIPAESKRMVNFFAINYGIVILSCIVPSLAFRQLTSKNGRIQFFSTPASTVEKYAVGVTIYVIGFAIVFAACVQLADLVRFAFINRDSAPVVLADSIKMMIDNRDLNWNGIPYYSWVAAVATAPLFFMGSILWPRWAVVKTFALTYVVSFFLIIVFPIMQFFLQRSTDSSSTIYKAQFQYFIDGFNLIMMVVCLVLSWYLFKRKNIVSLKWWE